ncbi:MAG: LLM class flavin-dependent oxidoreductase, partial [Pseudomonadales bacterium]
MSIALRLNMTGMQAEPKDEALRYRAAIDMAAYAEQVGFDFINLEEHHCADNGWLPSPLIMAGMIAARTERIRIGITALLVTLYDPIRLAEDIAILDLASNGRLTFVAGMGYRPDEYHAMDKSWQQRGKLMDEVVTTLLAAWTGEPFEYKGKTLRVTPVPVSRPHPFFFIGGMSAAAARRAARFNLPFYPPMPRPDLEAIYYEELAKTGGEGFVYTPDAGNCMTFVDDDPDSAWQELCPYLLNEMQEYASWKQDGIKRPSEDDVTSVEEV